MAWYGQKNYFDKVGNGPFTIAQIGCFLTAFCNLEQKFGKEVDPPSLNRLFVQRGIYLLDPEDGAGVRDDLGWNSVTAYDGQLHPVNINNSANGSWPGSPNSIVKFAYKSPKTGQPYTHFCLVADPAARTIIDSWDGVIRTPGYYGSPVAWAEYAETVPQPVIIPTAAPAPKQVSSATSGRTYVLQKGDTIWSVAMRFGTTAAALIQFNGITDVKNLPVGYVVHIPDDPAKPAAPPAPAPSYKIEVLAAPKLFHVSKAGGCEKWAFGNVTKWTDFKSNGHVAENTNITIAAVATVLVAGQATAYYMDGLALGDYATTGRAATTIGYSNSDLTEGPAPEATAAETTLLDGDTYTVQKGDSLWNIAERIVGPGKTAAIEAKMLELGKINGLPDPSKIAVGQVLQLKAPAAVPIPGKPAEVAPSPTPPSPAANEASSAKEGYKSSYVPFKKPTLFVCLPKDKSVDVIYCKEYDQRRSDYPLKKTQAASISGTFIYGQNLYGRPTGAVKHDYWYGVPMDDLVAENELYSTKLSLLDKLAMHKGLSITERAAVGLAWADGTLNKLKKIRSQK